MFTATDCTRYLLEIIILLYNIHPYSRFRGFYKFSRFVRDSNNSYDNYFRTARRALAIGIRLICSDDVAAAAAAPRTYNKSTTAY